MLWGYESLNGAWKNRFPEGLEDTPSDEETKTKKVIIFMTDGDLTGQHYVRENDKTGEPPFNSKRKTRVPYGQALNAFYNLCNKAKADDIEIYTVGYNITRQNHIVPLQRCASSSGHYVEAFSGDLESVFRGIAASISPLRIIK